MTLILNQTELSRVLGVSVPTLATLRAEGMPVLSEGKNGVNYEFDAEACGEWFKRHRAESRGVKTDHARAIEDFQGQLSLGDPDDDDLFGLGLSTTDIKRLYEIARQRDMIGLERGRLVRLERVEADYRQTFAYLRAALLGLADTLARDAGLTAEQTDQVHRASVDLIGNLHRMMKQNEVAREDH